MACLTALLGATGGVVSSAHADSTIACSALSTSQGGEAAPQALQIARSEPLYRFQDRPYLRIPVGVALWVKAPRGMTAADLHNLLHDCASKQASTTSPLCVKGAKIEVDRSGGFYVVRVTSDQRSTALEIQQRANAR
ncbi:MAG TPA: hypothetical protein VFZ61_00270 [Polyangiales bacterium]